MYTSQTLARERHLDQLERARQSRIGRQAAELRRLDRIRQRAERRLLRAWQRADDLRITIETTG